MRTDEQIMAHMKAVEDRDLFGTVRSDLLDYLPFDQAKQFLNPEVTEPEWKQAPRDKDAILGQMKAYMDFAWGKANDNRGLSAARSLDHMQAWLWMLGEESAADGLDDYSHYGKPQLRAICEHYGWDWRAWDDGRWTNDEIGDGVKPESVASLSLSWAAH